MLQYLVGVEGIAPDIITATSAGAIARHGAGPGPHAAGIRGTGRRDRGRRAGLDPDRARLRQAGLAGRAGGDRARPRDPQRDHRGHPPALPAWAPPAPWPAARRCPPAPPGRQRAATGAHGLAGSASATSCAWPPAPGSGCPGCAGTCAPAAARSSTSSPWPRPSVTAPMTASVPSTRRWSPGRGCSCAWPSPRCGPVSCATSPRTAPSSSPTPARRRRATPPARSTWSTAPSPRPACRMVFPPRAMADDDYVDGGVIEIVPVRAAADLGATRIIAVVAVPLPLARDERDYAAAPAGYIGLRVHGDDRRGGTPDRQPQRAPARGHDADHHRPGGRRGRVSSRCSRACCASTRTTAGCGPPTSWPRATPPSWPTWRTAPTPSSRPGGEAWRLEESLWAAGRADGTATPASLALRARAQGAGARARRPAQAARLPGARRLRGLVDRLRGPHAARPDGLPRTRRARRDRRP